MLLIELSRHLTFELPALQQRSRLLQREELLDGHKVVIYAGDLPVSGLSGGAWERRYREYERDQRRYRIFIHQVRERERNTASSNGDDT